MRPPLRRTALRIALWAVLAAMAVAAVALVRGVLLIAAYESESRPRPATIYDDRGGVIATLGRRQGAYVPFSQLPEALVNAVVAAEDRRFWSHRGVDLVGVGRAVLANFRSRTRGQGASTITQQLAKNLFLSPEKSFTRKGQEAVLAVLLELRYTKQEIFAMYVNEVYFGEGAYGVEEAARTYFGKPAADLSLPEAALLAALLPAPSVYTPYKAPDLALERRNAVLELMHDQGYIDEEALAAAKRAPIRLATRRGGQAPYFVDYVEQWLVARFGGHAALNSGLIVRTTLDPVVQSAAEEALGSHQGAIVALDPRSGAIKAMVGGRDYAESQFNRATQSTRQPGSAFKPVVYAAALERGWKMSDLVEDVRRDYGGYAPRNFRGEYWGPVTMKHALAHSLNSGTVWLLRRIGVESAYEMGLRLGITSLSPSDLNLALALGAITRGVTPLEMAKAYVPFASGGVLFEPFAVSEVRDAEGALLYRHRPDARRVLSREVAYFITDMLQAAVAYGTGTSAAIGRPQAGKTGTTDNNESAWFVGYTPSLVAAVYIGNDDGTPLAGGGGVIAAPVWGRFVAEALRDTPAEHFPVPANVRTGYPVDIFSGLAANENCRYREYDSFVWGQEPREPAPCALGEGVLPVPFPNQDGTLGNSATVPGDLGISGLPAPTGDGAATPGPFFSVPGGGAASGIPEPDSSEEERYDLLAPGSDHGGIPGPILEHAFHPESE